MLTLLEKVSWIELSCQERVGESANMFFFTSSAVDPPAFLYMGKDKSVNAAVLLARPTSR